MKTCTQCGDTLPLDSFYRSKFGIQGRASECKKCFLARNRARYRTASRPRASVLLSHAKTRAERKGLAFSLDVDWIDAAIKSGRCQITGLPFDLTLRGARNLFGPSLDRVVPEEGYTKENVKVVLFGYNSCKNTASEDEARDFFLQVAEAFR